MNAKVETKKPKLDMSAELRDRFNSVKIAAGFTGTQPEFLMLLLDSYAANSVFSETDREKIHAAAKKTNMSFSSIVVSGSLQYAEKLSDASESGKKVVGDRKINEVVNELMASNNAAKEWHEKIEITQRVVAELSKCNRENIKRYLSANKARIDEHHAKNNIEADHNRRVANYARKNKNQKVEV